MPNHIETDPDVADYRLVIDRSSKRTQRQLKFGIIATSIFLAGVLLTYLFLDIGPFHSHWEPFGKIALIFTFAAMLAALYYDLLAWTAWNMSRSSKRELEELIEDRFGATDK
jgi:hypothetical protein